MAMFAKVVKRRQQTLSAAAPPNSLAAAVSQPALTQPDPTPEAPQPLDTLEPHRSPPPAGGPTPKSLPASSPAPRSTPTPFRSRPTLSSRCFHSSSSSSPLSRSFSPRTRWPKPSATCFPPSCPSAEPTSTATWPFWFIRIGATQLFSVFMLLVTSTGVFLPLEVALNEVWGVKKHRNYLENQVVSLGLAAAVGILVLSSVCHDRRPEDSHGLGLLRPHG